MPNPPKLYTIGEESLTLKEWSKRTGTPVKTIDARLRLGWAVADAINVATDRRFKPKVKATKGAARPCPLLKTHRASKRAFCTWHADGERHTRYFGRAGTAEAEQGYTRFQLEWATRNVNKSPIPLGDSLTVAELVVQWLQYCEHGNDGEGGYRKHGRLTSEIHAHRSATNYLVDVHGDVAVNEFGPDQLRAVRKAMLAVRPIRKGKEAAQGLSRNTINGYQSRIVHMFHWGVGQKLVPEPVWRELKAVGQLVKGKSTARETPKKTAVPWPDVEAVLPHLHTNEACRAVLESLVRVHWWLGGRPEDVVSMRVCDLDRSEDVWHYVPETHKNEHREQSLEYWLGPKAQAILTPLLEGKSATDLVFAYPEADGSSVPIQRAVYGNRVKDACKRAGVKLWTPHQLRHSRATEVMRVYESNKAAAAIIGDSEEVARTIYVDPLTAVRKRIARETG